jgi:hypothetical protein
VGLVSLCLGNPIDRAIERLGTEDQRLAEADGTVHRWELGVVSVVAVADPVGSIVELQVDVTGDGRATAPDGIVVGATTLLEFIERSTRPSPRGGVGARGGGRRLRCRERRSRPELPDGDGHPPR